MWGCLLLRDRKIPQDMASSRNFDQTGNNNQQHTLSVSQILLGRSILDRMAWASRLLLDNNFQQDKGWDWTIHQMDRNVFEGTGVCERILQDNSIELCKVGASLIWRDNTFQQGKASGQTTLQDKSFQRGTRLDWNFLQDSRSPLDSQCSHSLTDNNDRADTKHQHSRFPPIGTG